MLQMADDSLPSSDAPVPVEVADYLEQDPTIRGQRYACVSFVSPRDAIAAKEAYSAKRFLSETALDVGKTLDMIVTVFGEANPAVRETVDLLRERHGYLWDEVAAQNEYSAFLTQQADDIDEGFRREFPQYRMNVHGLKIRGVYDTVDDAKERSKAIRRFDKKFNVFVAEVGCWCPWNPSVDQIQDTEYAETELNTLVKTYNEAQEAKDEVYNDRKNRSMEKMNKEREIWVERIKAEVAAREKERVEQAAADAADAAAAAAAEATEGAEGAEVPDAGAEGGAEGAEVPEAGAEGAE